MKSGSGSSNHSRIDMLWEQWTNLEILCFDTARSMELEGLNSHPHLWILLVRLGFMRVCMNLHELSKSRHILQSLRE